MSNDQAFARISALIEYLVAFPATRVTPETTLLADIGIGDDANEFLCRFTSEFGVDLSTFRFSKHFHEEGIHWSRMPIVYSFFFLVVLSLWLIPVWALVWWLWTRYFPLRKAEIRVSDLLRSIEAGRWIYDYPSA